MQVDALYLVTEQLILGNLYPVVYDTMTVIFSNSIFRNKFACLHSTSCFQYVYIIPIGFSADLPNSGAGMST
jgi:hypothetical protein